MLTSSRARKFLAASVALAAAAGIAATANTVSYAADNAGVNTDAPVFTTTGDAPAGTSGTFTTDIANPETATAAQVAADSSSSVTQATTTTGTYSANVVSAFNAKGGSITQNQVMTRAQSWVNEGVPYNQGGYKTDANGTYREDCSGFVSMAWNLPYSRTTWTLDDSSITSHISRSDLQPGDALDYDTEHVILFAGWRDKSAGTFYYYAESNPSVLTNEYVGDFNNSTIAGWPVGDYVYLRFNNIAAPTPPVTAPQETAARIAAGDFNGDGKTDIAGIDAYNNLKFYSGDGSGHVGGGTNMLGSTGLWKGFKEITAGDFNGDGKTDIAGIDANNNLKLYVNDGTGHLTDSGIYMLGSTGLWAGFKAITAGDFNGDGKTDIAGIDANNNLKLYTGNGTGHLTDSGTYMLGSTGLWAGFKAITAGNFTGNGKIDIAGIDANNNLKLYVNDGTGHLSGGSDMLGSTGLWAGFRGLVSGDFNGDGKQDIAGIDANNNMKLYTGSGAGAVTDSGVFMLGNTGLWSGFQS